MHRRVRAWGGCHWGLEAESGFLGLGAGGVLPHQGQQGVRASMVLPRQVGAGGRGCQGKGRWAAPTWCSVVRGCCGSPSTLGAWQGAPARGQVGGQAQVGAAQGTTGVVALRRGGDGRGGSTHPPRVGGAPKSRGSCRAPSEAPTATPASRTCPGAA